jgi:hypothetical protein
LACRMLNAPCGCLPKRSDRISTVNPPWRSRRHPLADTPLPRFAVGYALSA